MATSLTPAYLRIAGPSTALMSYHNSSITIDEDTEPFEPKTNRFQTFFSENLARIDEAFKKSRGDKRHRRTDVKEEGWVITMFKQNYIHSCSIIRLIMFYLNSNS